MGHSPYCKRAFHPSSSLSGTAKVAQVLSVTGSDNLYATIPAWKDVVNVPRGGSVTILVPVMDFSGMAMFHCHILEHEDIGMMGQWDLMDMGVRVNTILPGIFDTPLMQGAPQQVKDNLAASVPFPKRLGNPPEYANLALTMIENGYFNGEDVRLDGAIRMAPR